MKGLRDIQFGEGESLTFEVTQTDFSEGVTMDDKEVKSLERIGEQIKSFFNLGKPPEATANFGEADLTKRITDAVTVATASFSEKITSLENENKSLRTAVDKHANSTTHAELVAFCERLGPAKCPPAFLNMGLVAFMESLAGPGLEAGKVTVVSFSEEGGKKVETKPSRRRSEGCGPPWVEAEVRRADPLTKSRTWSTSE